MFTRVAVAVTIAGSIAAAAAVALAATGRFSGTTSQGGPDYTVSFRVSQGQVKGFHITWRGRCVSQQQIFLATSQGSARIAIRGGRWSSRWKYRAKLPYASDVTGQFTVTEDTGLVSGNRVHGTFSVEATIYQGNSVNDHCRSGRITWSARRS
jgi:hypothetical protein